MCLLLLVASPRNVTSSKVIGSRLHQKYHVRTKCRSLRVLPQSGSGSACCRLDRATRNASLMNVCESLRLWTRSSGQDIYTNSDSYKNDKQEQEQKCREQQQQELSRRSTVLASWSMLRKWQIVRSPDACRSVA